MAFTPEPAVLQQLPQATSLKNAREKRHHSPPPLLADCVVYLCCQRTRSWPRARYTRPAGPPRSSIQWRPSNVLSHRRNGACKPRKPPPPPIPPPLFLSQRTPEASVGTLASLRKKGAHRRSRGTQTDTHTRVKREHASGRNPRRVSRQSRLARSP